MVTSVTNGLLIDFTHWEIFKKWVSLIFYEHLKFRIMDKRENQKTRIKAGCGFTIFAAIFILFCCINPVITVAVFMMLVVLIASVY